MIHLRKLDTIIISLTFIGLQMCIHFVLTSQQSVPSCIFDTHLLINNIKDISTRIQMFLIIANASVHLIYFSLIVPHTILRRLCFSLFFSLYPSPFYYSSISHYLSHFHSLYSSSLSILLSHF